MGSEGTLYVPVPYKPGIREKIILQRGDKTEVREIKGVELYSGEVEDMADAVLTGKPQRMSLADSRGNVATILALLDLSAHREADTGLSGGRSRTSTGNCALARFDPERDGLFQEWRGKRRGLVSVGAGVIDERSLKAAEIVAGEACIC